MNFKNIGKIIQIKDNIIWISGLSKVGYNQLITIKTSTGLIDALVLNLQANMIGAVVLGDSRVIHQGDIVEFSGESLKIKVDEKLLGNIINPLGYSLIGKKSLVATSGKEMSLERIASGVLARQNVFKPLYTGIFAIDLMIPVGCGQRQLIIGDKKTGKTSVCIDTILNQKDKNVICIYVAIGQKAASVSRIRQLLIEKKAMDYTVIVAANASDPASMQYLAPYSGCAIAEYFAEKGKDVLIVYDDLSKHAVSYREISLLLNRPAGREAYPGDVFYLHSRLLERALQYSEKLGGGSITALPIVETQLNDITTYIPTNIISITDGQIYFDTVLFNSGQRPAINIGDSVSRVGSDAQNSAVKKIAGPLKLDLAQFRELQAFASFGADLDKSSTTKLKRGALIFALLNQFEQMHFPISHQVVIFYAVINDLVKYTSIHNVVNWRFQFLDFLKTKGVDIISQIESGQKVEGELEKKLLELVNQFNKTYGES
ncbi:MAG: F0F1 ATP synthase subunit alpha [Candidatus Shapirobacteria bacterium]|jgi:F-type H+-transporting ATPase subunit alpha